MLLRNVPHTVATLLIALTKSIHNTRDRNSRVEPMPAYRHVLPFPEEAIRRAAYYFRYEHPGFEDSVEKGREIMHAQWEWAALHQGGKQGELRVVKGERGRHDLVDTRAHVARGTSRVG